MVLPMINITDRHNINATPSTISSINDAIASDSKNGAIWVSAISFYATTGDDAGVMDSIDALEKTSLFNERFGEKALVYAQALEGSTSNNFNMNAIAGIVNMGKMGVDAIREFGKESALLFDVKSVFSADQVDIRL